jgi:hypothetical protein
VMASISCRLCGSVKIANLPTFGRFPFANIFPNDPKALIAAHNLQLCVCEDCGLCQLSDFPNTSELFDDYIWRTATSLMVHEYLEELSARLLPHVAKRGTIVEIASNDCTLLRKFRHIFDKRIGIEPASNFELDHKAAEATYVNEYFTSKLVKKRPNLSNSANLIVARNVLAHVPNIKDFISTIYEMLTSDGIVYFEFHDGDSIIDMLQFDSIYHEHQSYITYEVIAKFLNKLGFDVLDTWVGPIGGSSRSIVCSKKEGGNIVAEACEVDTKAVSANVEYAKWQGFREKCDDYKKTFRETLSELRAAEKKIYGFGASARSTTLGIFCGASEYLDGFIDSASHKKGRFWTGSQLQIQNPKDVNWMDADIIVIFAWNFYDEVRSVIREAGFTGDIYRVLPNKLIKV